MADASSVHRRLPVALNQEYRVKLGKSFTFPKENAFHTIKYDFKPKSIDPSQPGRLKVNGDEVSVSMPVMQAESVDDVAVFKGARQPCRKECILIINTESGEAILEKINNTILLKGVRDQTKRKKIRSASPIPSKIKPTPPPPSLQTSHTPSKVGGTATPTAGKSVGKKSAKKKVKVEKPAAEKQQTSVSCKTPSSSQQQNSNILSMPILPTSTCISPIHSNNATPEPPSAIKRERLSSSSQSDLSGSGDDSSDSDSDSEMEHISDLLPTQQFTNAPSITATPTLISTQGSSDYKESLGVNVPMSMQYGVMDPAANLVGGISLSGSSSGSSSSSSGSSDSSDSDSSSEDGQLAYHHTPSITTAAAEISSRPRTISVLRKDLELSDSDESD